MEGNNNIVELSSVARAEIRPDPPLGYLIYLQK
jgi:hypothetical protein